MRYCLLVSFFLSFTCFAQLVDGDDRAGAEWVRIAPPTMQLADSKLKPMELRKLDVNVIINGSFAETQMTMTFYNRNSRALAGDLVFPLPEGALVSGYALDVNGVMVDGSIVKKDKARQVFEAEVRKGIDPGLVEFTQGNNYKTRVFPLPARGTRTIKVKYVNELIHGDGELAYHLPLNYHKKIREFDLKVEVVRSDGRPTVTKGALANFSFAKWQSRFVAKTQLRNAQLNDDMIIAVPQTDSNVGLVRVETALDGETYFSITHAPAHAGSQISPKMDRSMPATISLVWDASGSRQRADHQRELSILEGYLEALTEPKSTEVIVEVRVLRNTLSAAESFNINKRKVSQLIDYLDAIKYDGGTQMGALQALNELSEKSSPDLYLLFTDGLTNFGEASFEQLSAPAYVISSDNRSNHALLKSLAYNTGGNYFNLSVLANDDVINAIGVSRYGVVSTAVNSGDVEEIIPVANQGVGRHFIFTGKLISDQATIKLNFGASGEIQDRVSFVVSRDHASNGNLLRTVWAQAKVNQLLIHEPENETAFIELGKTYGLVTPGTSLLVLETLAQYIEHQVLPPASLPEFRDGYGRHIKLQDTQAKQAKNRKIERMVGLWQQRVQWWSTDFKSILKHQSKSKIGGLEQNSDISLNAPAPSAVMADSAEDLDLEEVVVTGSRNRASRQGERRRSRQRRETAKEKSDAGANLDGAIKLTAWDPKTPYLKELKAASVDQQFEVYFKQRADYRFSASFYLDCAEFFYQQKRPVFALQVLSNITELELENPALTRVAAHRLRQAGELELSRLLFEEVLSLRPEEPQSYRDLAFVLAEQDKFSRAVELLYDVVLKDWTRFVEIELIALMEMNHIIAKAKTAGVKDFNVDERLVKLLDLGVRIVMTWDADATDIDLWVTEPSGEKAYYGNNRTAIGGLVSRDFTQGYGPEEYLLKKSMPGTYKIQANYYGSRSASLTGPVTLQLDIYSNYGRDNEQHQTITLRLETAKEVVNVGEVTF